MTVRQEPVSDTELRDLAAKALEQHYYDGPVWFHADYLHDVMDSDEGQVFANADTAYIAAISPDRLLALLVQKEALVTALGWAMAPNPRYEGRHRTEPRCDVFMPTDSACSCGFENARRALAAASDPAVVKP